MTKPTGQSWEEKLTQIIKENRIQCGTRIYDLFSQAIKAEREAAELKVWDKATDWCESKRCPAERLAAVEAFAEKVKNYVVEKGNPNAKLMMFRKDYKLGDESMVREAIDQLVEEERRNNG